MDVREIDFARVDGIPARFLKLERHPKTDCVSLWKVDVDRGPGLSATEDPNLERKAALVKSPRAPGERSWHGMRTAGVGETTNAQGSAVGNQLRSFLSRSNRKSPV